MLAAVGAFHAHAASLQVNPTSLSLPAKQRAGIFTLGNTGSEPLTAQVRVYGWSQDEKGNEVLTPTDAVIASPPMVKLEAGAKQQFRVIRIRPSENRYRRTVVFRRPEPRYGRLSGQCPCQRADDLPHLFLRHIRVHRQAQHSSATKSPTGSTASDATAGCLLSGIG